MYSQIPFLEANKTRTCPSCNNLVIYQDCRSWYRANKAAAICKSCAVSQSKGNKFIQANKQRVCDMCNSIITYSSYKHWLRAEKQHSPCFKCSMIKAGINKRGKYVGIPCSEQVKRKLRQRAAKRILTLGIKSCEDKGASKFFDNLRQNGTLITCNKYFKEIGYFADGYDSKQHVWYEYDTKYHKRREQIVKDKARQDSIIKYFVSIGKPLNGFIRYDAVDQITRNVI